MAICVVIKPFKAYGEPYETGDLVDASSFRNEGNLISSRYLRPASPEEYATAVGLTFDYDQNVSRLKNATSVTDDPADTPDVGDDDQEDGGAHYYEENDAPPAAAKAVKKKAKSAPVVRKKTALRH
jgi:hypothetical protein